MLANDLVENLDGTQLSLQAGETYTLILSGLANASGSVWMPTNAEAEISVTWEID